MTWAEFNAAYADAKRTMGLAESVAADMGRMLAGNLRRCDPSTLKQLKDELRRYNTHTRKWSKP